MPRRLGADHAIPQTAAATLTPAVPVTRRETRR